MTRRDYFNEAIYKILLEKAAMEDVDKLNASIKESVGIIDLELKRRGFPHSNVLRTLNKRTLGWSKKLSNDPQGAPMVTSIIESLQIRNDIEHHQKIPTAEESKFVVTTAADFCNYNSAFSERTEFRKEKPSPIETARRKAALQNGYKGPIAQQKKTMADIVFCIDSTGSMAPCIDGLKSNLKSMIEGLASAAELDYRFRLISFRDRHDSTNIGEPWLETPFTDSVSEFSSQLSGIKACGGGTHQDGESSLDALYLAIRSNWRPGKCHRAIVLCTDEDAHPRLHKTTYNIPNRPVGDVDLIRVCPTFCVNGLWTTFIP